MLAFKRLRSGALGREMDRLRKAFFQAWLQASVCQDLPEPVARFSQFATTRCGPMPIHQEVLDRRFASFYAVATHWSCVGTGTRAASGSPGIGLP